MGELLTAEELAVRLQVRPSTVRLWGRQGRIPVTRLSKKVLRYDLAAAIEALTKGQSVAKGRGHD